MAAPTTDSWSSGFAKKQLEKHGWKEGKGLGREESGISAPVKVRIKNDKAGVGHDLGEQFTYHWWDHVFNKAADNIQVDTSEGEVKVKQRGDNSKLISNKKQHTKTSKKPLLYGNFVKSATLTQDGEEPDATATVSSDDDEPDTGANDGNREEEFFKACGGRTAHKGARHGLKQNGKLRRIQEQESLFTQMSKNENNSVKNDAKDTGQKRKKMKVKEFISAESGIDCIEAVSTDITVEDGHLDQKLKKKRKRTKSKRTKQEIVEGNDVNEDIRTFGGKIFDGTTTHGVSKEMNDTCIDDESRKKKKKRKKSKSNRE